MPIYNYTALKNNKDIVKGKVEAENHKEARAIIRKMSLCLINLIIFSF